MNCLYASHFSWKSDWGWVIGKSRKLRCFIENKEIKL